MIFPKPQISFLTSLKLKSSPPITNNKRNNPNIMHEERRGDAERRRMGNVLAFKIGAIFAAACGSSSTKRLVSENTQRKRRGRRRLRLSQLSGFLRKGSSGLVSLRKWRMMIKANETTKKVEEVELCKKRILMGDKCRPLNPSGLLHYDHHGVLLPDQY